MNVTRSSVLAIRTTPTPPACLGWLVARPQKRFVLGRFFGCLFRAALIASPATSAIAADDLCIEDGGQAMCIGPEIGPWTYIATDTGGWEGVKASTEAAAIESYRQLFLPPSGRACSITATDMTPAWLEGAVSEGNDGFTQGDRQAARDLNGTYVSRGWTLSTEHAQSKGPVRIDETGFIDTTCTTSWSYGAFITRDRSVGCPNNRYNLDNWDLWKWNKQTPPLSAYCWRWPSAGPERRKNLGPQCTTLGNPVNAATGNKVAVERDYPGDGADSLRFIRTYNSGLWPEWDAPSAGHNAISRMGPNWRSNFDAWISVSGAGRFTTAYANRPDGRTIYFKLSQNAFKADTDIVDRLEQLTGTGGQLTGWRYTAGATGDVETYNALGRLVSIQSRSGKVLSLQYDGSERLSLVADAFGRTLSFAYDASNRLATVSDPAGNVYTYTYNNTNNLLSVNRPNSAALTYVYGEQASPYVLTGIIDENNSRFATYKYNADGRVTSTEHAGGIDKYWFSYEKPAGIYTNALTTVTDPLGETRLYTLATVQGVSRLAGVSQPCSGGCMGGGAQSLTYDANGNIASKTDFKGNKICYAYDLTRNLETVRVEGFATGMTCPADLASYLPTSGTRQRKISTLWHPTHRLPSQIDESGRRTTFTRDSSGNELTRTVLDTVTSESRTWTYTYNGFGQVLTADGPRTDVSDITTYTYYTCTTGYQCGQMNTITNALGDVTTYNTYNAHGYPLTIIDPNGVVTTLTYDLRQRLTSRTVGTELTSFDYWPTGLLKKATLPDGSYLQYTYDAAHRLIEINDSLNNRIHYTLDNMGNRTKEESFDPTSVLTQTRSRVFNTLNQLSREIGAAGTSQVTTKFGYDNNGNQTSIAAPMSRNTGQTYDELNRLATVTDPGSGITTYGYNALDQLISVTDPKNLATTYTYNGLGDLKQQVSPDTGTTTNTYDSAGNLATKTDARGASIGRGTYTYDALNRVTQIVYPDHSVTYQYDNCTNGVGRLCTTTDAGGTTGYQYDAQGRVTMKAQTVSLGSGQGQRRREVHYTYTDGLLTRRRVLPSGVDVYYEHNAAGRVSAIRAQLPGGDVETVLSDVLYDINGRVHGWTWGNGTFAVREYDLDGRPQIFDSNGQSTFTYDYASRLTAVTTDGSVRYNMAPSWSHAYDGLDRLTSASRSGLSVTYAYDANGNRTQQGGTSASSYSYGSPFTSNRLVSISGSQSRAYQYDAAGNVISDGLTDFTYDGAGRMVGSSSGATTYSYNGLGQRIVKRSAGELEASYLYDEEGHLIEKCPGYNLSGDECESTAHQQMIWLDDIPVAAVLFTLLLDSEGYVDYAFTERFNIHTDHLNTPRRMTRTDSQSALIWAWRSDPFGVGPALSLFPGYQSGFQLDLRLPGQVFDAETGLHYNYFRDYDPATGRYVQSDPIGLQGGLNTYAYVGGNPVAYIDPTGEFLGPALAVARVGYSAYRGYRAARAGAAVAAAAAAASSSSLPNAANEDEYGDDNCPPDCRTWRQTLNLMYQSISKMESLPQHFSAEYTQQSWDFFWRKVRVYEKVCGPYVPPPSISEIYLK